jgi:hypothetical protein
MTKTYDLYEMKGLTIEQLREGYRTITGLDNDTDFTDEALYQYMLEALYEPKMRVCRHCLMAFESRAGKQVTRPIYVDSENEEESKCEWCEDNGFGTLYEFI